MFVLTHLSGFGGGGGDAVAPPKILTFRTTEVDAVDRAAYTFSAVAIGTAAADRRVHVAVHSYTIGAESISSVTVGGVTATLNHVDDAGDVSNVIATALVPTGTTADVVVTFSGTVLNCRVGVWTSTGLTSNTAHATDVDGGIGTSVVQFTSTLNGGFFIAMCTQRTTTAGTFSWANATERYDATGEDLNESGADAATVGGTLDVTIDDTENASQIRALGAAF